MNYRTLKQIVFLFFIATMLGSGYGVDARLQRWENRTEKLGKCMSIIEHGDYLPSAREIISNEIESSKNMTSILTRYSVKDGSLKSETKKYSVAEIESATGKFSSPVISLYYLLDLTRRLNDPRVSAEVLAWISAYAAGKNLPAVKAGDPDAGKLVSGYINEMSMGEYRSFKESCYRKILGRVEYELSRSDYSSNDIDMERLITGTAVAECELMTGESRTVLEEKYLMSVPQWRIITGRAGKSGARNLAAESFALEKNMPADEVRGRDVGFIAAKIFRRESAPLVSMINNSTASVSTGGNNPMYEIPDMKSLSNAVDDIDRYRETLLKRMDGSEDRGFAARVRENNSGIAEKYINKYESFFRREEARIAGLRRNNSRLLVYNEEMFLVSKKHFNEIKSKLREYAELSSDFIEKISGAGKIDPESFIDNADYMSSRENEYITFIEKLAEESSVTGSCGDSKINNAMKQAIKESIACIKEYIKPLTIPPEIRRNMTKDHVKSVASINESRKTRGTMYASSVRKHYDNYIAAYNKSKGDSKAAEQESEGRIAQHEIDILFGFAKKCSDTINSMETTSSFLKEYRDLYESASADIREKGSSSIYYSGTENGTLLSMVTKSSPGDVDREVRSRDMLAAEGMDALSSAVSLCQHYSRNGVKVGVVPSQKEIAGMRRSFTIQPEIKVGSWTMNGKNFRQVDLNCTESLRVLKNRTANNPRNFGGSNSPVVLSCGGIELSFNTPGGWTVTNIACESGSGIKLDNPDGSSWIEVYAINSEVKYLQEFSETWLNERGFTPVEKSWGKVKGEDYIRTISRDKDKKVCETRMFIKNGAVIIVNGVSEKNRARNMNGFVEKLFVSMNF